MIYLKQSTASQEVLLGPFVDSTDGVTAETGLTIANTDIKIWVAGATTLASKNSGGATHISNGNYYAVLDATDTATLGSGAIVVQVSGALAVRHDICILAANVYDSLIGGGDILDVSTTQWNGTAVGSTEVRANLINIAGSAVNTSSAQLGVNLVNAAGTAWNSGAIQASTFASNAISLAKLATDARNALGFATTGTLSGTHSDTTADLGTSAPTADITGQTLYFSDHDLSRIVTSYDTGTGVATFDSIGVTLANGNTWYRYPTATISGIDLGDGSGFTAIPWNASWDAEVQSECTDALNAYDAPTRTEATSDKDEILTAVSGLNDLDAAGVRTAVGLASANLDTQIGTLATAANLATVDTNVDAIKAKTDSLTFTTAGIVDANVQQINDVTITGDGQVGTEFGV